MRCRYCIFKICFAELHLRVSLSESSYCIHNIILHVCYKMNRDTFPSSLSLARYVQQMCYDQPFM